VGSYESFLQTTQQTILPPIEIKVKTLAISVRRKDIGLQNVQIVTKTKKVLEETKVKIPVIIVKRKDIGLQTVLRNNKSKRRRRRILNRMRKRYPLQKKKFDTFTKTRKEDETTVRKKMKKKNQ
jgi:hypothetical protein